MSGVFVSYRRSDSQDVAGRIFDRLIAHFTPRAVFKDVDSLPVGVPFRAYVVHAISASDAVLVLIGPTWSTCCDSNGRRRLENGDDVVRLEIETALRLGRPTLPITVSNAQLPASSDLPESLRELLEFNGQAVRPDPDFNNDVRYLIQHLASLLGPARLTREDSQRPDRSLLERLLQMVQGWHNEIIDTTSQLSTNSTDQEVERIAFRYLNTRNFLAQIVSIRKVLSNLAWAATLQSRVDDFLSFLTYREAPDDSAMCRPLHCRQHTYQARGLDLSDPLQLQVLNSALQGIADEITALLAESCEARSLANIPLHPILGSGAARPPLAG